MCMTYGAYLTEITSQEENNFVSQLVRQNHLSGKELWIGGSDTLSEGHWIWGHSETLLQYQNWNVGEPDDDNGQDCLTIRLDGRWDDLRCDDNTYGICEKRKYTNPEVGK
ncbi:perlucin-like protein [Gigantopelta aegis]|uniref:perlucin-like protein n=1 Tax=Gigantopelta aegis TaxID=1735272 RepID=UPI001B88CEAB|nr:perlucin-like protein [Gigantopelta aegis]